MEVLDWTNLSPEERQRIEDLALLGTLEENFQRSVREGKIAKTQVVSRRDRRRFDAAKRHGGDALDLRAGKP